MSMSDGDRLWGIFEGMNFRETPKRTDSVLSRLHDENEQGRRLPEATGCLPGIFVELPDKMRNIVRAQQRRNVGGRVQPRLGADGRTGCEW